MFELLFLIFAFNLKASTGFSLPLNSNTFTHGNYMELGVDLYKRFDLKFSAGLKFLNLYAKQEQLLKLGGPYFAFYTSFKKFSLEFQWLPELWITRYKSEGREKGNTYGFETGFSGYVYSLKNLKFGIKTGYFLIFGKSKRLSNLSLGINVKIG